MTQLRLTLPAADLRATLNRRRLPAAVTRDTGAAGTGTVLRFRRMVNLRPEDRLQVTAGR